MVYSVETEKETIGHPFFVMEKVNGVSASHLLRNERDSLQTVEIIAKTLASVHRVNANLFSQDKRMNHQFAQQKLSNIEKLVNIEYVANLSPFLRANYLRVIRKLREEAPRDFTPTILHGDFGPDHVFITDNGPVIIDWECADLGDPAYDVGWAYHIMLLEGQSMIDHRFVPSHGQKTLSSDLGEHFVRCYENCHGKLDNLSFYKNLAAIRLLTIFDPYLRPNLYSSLRNVMYMGVRETISRTFNIRSDTRSFHNYCTRFLRKGGYLA
jgi:aminoglycoside phosphotransferase (APT) family kinase protein